MQRFRETYQAGADNGWQWPNAECRLCPSPFCWRGVPRHFSNRRRTEKDNAESNHSTQESSDHDGQKGAANTEKRADHEHHFDVAKPHTIAAANEFVKNGGGPQKAST